jgi:uncharacterized caspase-like protein
MRFGGDLPPVKADIAMLKVYLMEQEHFDEVIVLTNENFNILNLSYFLERYLPDQLNDHPKGRFLFAFSGHGKTEYNLGYLLTAQAKSTDDVGNGISLLTLRSFLNRAINAAHHTLVLVNACEPRGFTQVSFGGDSLVPAHPGAHAIMAGGSGERTWSDSRPGRQGSLFFEVVIDGLQGGADAFPDKEGSKGDGIITASQLLEYVRQEIQRLTNQMQNPDGGSIAPDKQAGSFFFFNAQRQLAAGLSEPWEQKKRSSSAPSNPEGHGATWYGQHHHL